jgi:hypothetical protein
MNMGTLWQITQAGGTMPQSLRGKMGLEDESEWHFFSAIPWRTYLDVWMGKPIDVPMRRKIVRVWQFHEATEAESEALAIKTAW